jgi:hypothetical protein
MGVVLKRKSALLTAYALNKSLSTILSRFLSNFNYISLFRFGSRCILVGSGGIPLSRRGGHGFIIEPCESRVAWAKPKACSFCDNTPPEIQIVLSASQEGAPLRLDACKKCGRYIKTYDYRKAAPTEAAVPEVEDAASIYMDLAAEKEKYTRG